MKQAPSRLAMRRMRRGLSLEDMSRLLWNLHRVSISATTLHRAEHGNRALSPVERQAINDVLSAEPAK